jgi:hypothetical protein
MPGKYPLHDVDPFGLAFCLVKQRDVAPKKSCEIEAKVIRRIESLIRAAGRTRSLANGGLTIWNDNRRRPRALFYWGPSYKGLDAQIREFVRHLLDDTDEHWCVSKVENPNNCGWPTATRGDPMGY